MFSYFPTQRDLLHEVLRALYEPLIRDVDAGYAFGQEPIPILNPSRPRRPHRHRPRSSPTATPTWRRPTGRFNTADIANIGPAEAKGIRRGTNGTVGRVREDREIDRHAGWPAAL